MAYDYIQSLTAKEVRALGSTPEQAAAALLTWAAKHNSDYAEPDAVARRALVAEVERFAFCGETMVDVINPFTGARIQHDISDLTQAQLDAYAQVMDDKTREAVHSELAPCSPAQFLAEYARRVGPAEAGKLILGS